MSMIKYPSIEQYRTVITNVKRRATYAGRDENGDIIYDATKVPPTLKYRGTVKLHGTNAGIVYDICADDFQYQSRERVLTLTSDNAGFALYMSSKEGVLRDLFNQLVEGVDLANAAKVAVYGEWCGSSIQKGVAITQLDKMFVIFGVKLIDTEGTGTWLNLAERANIEAPEHRIFNVLRFGSWEIDIDFTKPELAQNKMIEITEAVEAECPAGKHFGVSGIGEGVVWNCITEGWRSSDFTFKVKGEKHSASKVKTLAAIDVEAVQAIHDFIDMAVTEARLEQGLQNLINEQQKPFDMTSLGDFIRWVFNDVMKEEMDTIVASQLDPKKLGGPIANKARPWFIAKYNNSDV